MANAKITMPGGVSVDVEGTADEVAAVLENLRRTQKDIGTASTSTAGGPKRRGTIPQLIDSLKAEEYFKAPRTLSDIRGKLGELGHHYPLTTLSGAMVAQRRTRNLRGYKQDGKYVYVQ
jgi:hypothetical protein